MKHIQIIKRVVLASTIGIAFLLSGCSTSQPVSPYQNKPAATIYAVGHQYLQKGNYLDAITAFRELNAQYPMGHYSELGTVEMIYAYFKNSDQAMSLAVAEQFVKFYPQSSYLGYVYYMMGVIHFNNGRGFLQKHLPYTMSEHDPANYKLAVRELQKALTLGGKHTTYLQDAKRRIVYLNNTIAQYYLNIAQYNFNYHAYVGAINRAKEVVEHYPRSDAAEKALVILIQSYKALNLDTLAQSTSQILKKNYPNNAYLLALKKAKDKATVVLN